MTANIRHAHGQNAQLHILTVPFENNYNNVYLELFQGVVSFLEENEGYYILNVNGPYLEDDDTLALDIVVDN